MHQNLYGHHMRGVYALLHVPRGPVRGVRQGLQVCVMPGVYELLSVLRGPVRGLRRELLVPLVPGVHQPLRLHVVPGL